MKNSLLSLAMILLFTACAKEEFAVNKGKKETTSTSAVTTTAQLCSQSTLIRPPVDILMLWDNSTSFNVVTPATKASMGNLISSVSENFDYHILSVPLISSNTNTLHEAQLVARDASSVSGSALGVIRTKEQVASSLSFTLSSAAAEPGVDRVLNIIQQNRANGIFRQNAYTMIVVISNEDDDSCEMDDPNGVATCATTTWQSRLQPKINKLLCLRGNTSIDCSSAGVSPLNSTMMRFINISPLASCSIGNYKFPNARYKTVAKQIYEAQYTNGWPTSNDHLSPDVAGAPDSYNLCSISFSNIFDGVNSAIKQTLLRHKYDYWPVTGSNTPLDPDTLRVQRTDGKILANRTGESNPTDGYRYVGALTNQPTRYFPTSGENFTGKMIELIGTDGNDKIVYPDCLSVTFTEPKAYFGYIYLSQGKPIESTIEVYLNGVKIPKSSTNGWSYMGLLNIGSLDTANYKVVDLPAGAPSGYFVQLNGSFKVSNSTANTFVVYYTSTGN